GPAQGGELSERANRRGTGTVVTLSAYENDVIHALAKTGGLPGTDAQNEIIVERRSPKGASTPELIVGQLQTISPECTPGLAFGGPVVRIPLRLAPDEPPAFGPQDVILQSGDIVFIESRRAEVYYTAGLLPPGEHLLPRDTDLDVVDAVIRVHGPLVSGGSSVSNLSGTIIAPGIGAPSPSLLTVMRKTACGGRIPIRINLNRAIRDCRERILVQAGDELILQEAPCQAVT